MRDGIPPILEGHPLAAQVVRLAQARGIDLTDGALLARIVADLEGLPVDARTVLLMADVVERLARIDRVMAQASSLRRGGGPAAGTDVVL